MRLLGGLEGAHRLEKTGSRNRGQVIGLFGFDLPGDRLQRTWLRAPAGAEADVGPGTLSLTANPTTHGEAPSLWLAMAYRRAF